MKKHLFTTIIIAGFCFCAHQGFAQKNAPSDTELNTDKPARTFAVAPKPTFNILEYINSNIRYPAAAIDQNIQGTVVVRFVVNTDGSISDVVATKELGGGCTAEAIRVIKAMPKWTPGRNAKGEYIAVYYQVPVKFVLQDDEEVVKAKDAPVPPAFPNGYDGIKRYIQSNMQFPKAAKGLGLKEGAVFIKYFINADGTVSDPEVVSATDNTFMEEAVRLIKNMPPWKPAEDGNGNKIKCLNFTNVEFGLKK